MATTLKIFWVVSRFLYSGVGRYGIMSNYTSRNLQVETISLDVSSWQVKHQRMFGRFLCSQKFLNFRNKDKWHEHYLEKLPETPKIYEFWKHEPFNRNFWNGTGKREVAVFRDSLKYSHETYCGPERVWEIVVEYRAEISTSSLRQWHGKVKGK